MGCTSATTNKRPHPLRNTGGRAIGQLAESHHPGLRSHPAKKRPAVHHAIPLAGSLIDLKYGKKKIPFDLQRSTNGLTDVLACPVLPAASLAHRGYSEENQTNGVTQQAALVESAGSTGRSPAGGARNVLSRRRRRRRLLWNFTPPPPPLASPPSSHRPWVPPPCSHPSPPPRASPPSSHRPWELPPPSSPPLPPPRASPPSSHRPLELPPSSLPSPPPLASPPSSHRPLELPPPSSPPSPPLRAFPPSSHR